MVLLQLVVQLILNTFILPTWTLWSSWHQVVKNLFSFFSRQLNQHLQRPVHQPLLLNQTSSQFPQTFWQNSPEGSLQRWPSHWWLVHHMTMDLEMRKFDQVDLIGTHQTTCRHQDCTLPFVSFVEGLIQPGDKGGMTSWEPFLWTDDLDKCSGCFGKHESKALFPKPQLDVPLDPGASLWPDQSDPGELEESPLTAQDSCSPDQKTNGLNRYKAQKRIQHHSDQHPPSHHQSLDKEEVSFWEEE